MRDKEEDSNSECMTQYIMLLHVSCDIVLDNLHSSKAKWKCWWILIKSTIDVDQAKKIQRNFTTTISWANCNAKSTTVIR
jgi:hypothetical protein